MTSAVPDLPVPESARGYMIRDEVLHDDTMRDIAAPIVAAELRAQAEHMDWVAAGAGERYALAAADFAPRFRDRADELDPEETP